MIIKQLRDEDFTSYKKPSMVIGFPRCSFKCEKECGIYGICQNSELAKSADIEVSIDYIITRYLNNPITKAIICAGLEPFDSWNDLEAFILNFRYHSPDPIIIYTGYNEDEIDKEKIDWLKLYGPIIIKFGRYIPNTESRFDSILGVTLASNNQYAKRIDKENTMHITINPDKEYVDQITTALKENNGYCPCRPIKSEDTKCRCKEFTNQINDPDFEGYCHCRLYYKHK